MSTRDTSVLIDPHPCRHIVYPYNDESKAINAVCLFAGSGLSKGESVILIMADSRRDVITDRLACGGFNLEALRETRQLECISADDTLRTLMPNGVLDDALFTEAISEVIKGSRISSPVRRVRVFGEMVSLLLARNELEAARRMEELWNEIIAAQSISLFCTYTLLDSGYETLPDAIATLHSHNLPSWSHDVHAAAMTLAGK